MGKKLACRQYTVIWLIDVFINLLL
jgi:hypothetical protein